MDPDNPTLRASLWLLASALLHALALVSLVVVRDLQPLPPPPPVPVKLLPPEPPPPEEPKPEPEFRPLQFRPATPPAVHEQVELPKEKVALVPPPPDAVITPEAGGGGLAIDRAGPSALGGFTLAGEGGGIAGLGIGRGNATGVGGSFQQYVGELRQVGLDVVFVIDATGSMGWLISEVKDHVDAMAASIRRLVPVTRFGVVAYRDYDDPEFVTLVEPLTLNVGRVHAFLDQLQARGGGDPPEAVDAGLQTAMQRAGWKADSKHVIVILGDAPPHPERMQATLDLARSFHAGGGTVTAIDVSFDANPKVAAARLHKRVEDLLTIERRGVMPEFQEIAKSGGGDASNLEGDRTITRSIAVLIFGKRWAEQVRPLLGDL